MAKKQQVINGIVAFMDNHMIPKAEGNYKTILRIARSGMHITPDRIWNAVKDNALVDMLGVIDGEQVDIDTLCRILTEGLENDEFNLSFKLLGGEYKIFISAEDVKTIKSYIERS